jgi:hypothetical protein
MLNKLADKTNTCITYNYSKVEPHFMSLVGLKQFLDRVPYILAYHSARLSRIKKIFTKNGPNFIIF